MIPIHVHCKVFQSLIFVVGCPVPREMDGPGGDPVRQVHRQVGRLVLRGAAHGALYLRTGSLSR